MAAYDHSLTYRSLAFRNVPHRLRRRHILSTVSKLKLPSGLRYADFGCSNGYLTNMVAHQIQAGRIAGFDHTDENLAVARTRHPHIDFRYIDLNTRSAPEETFEFITCFETLEHVGDPDAALDNLLSRLAPGGQLLASVPIEVGPTGLTKFLTKVLFYRYSLDELTSDPSIKRKYFLTLMTGGRLGRFRRQKPGWGTHFGFDYRDLAELINAKRPAVTTTSWSDFTTRFFLIRG